MVKVLLTRKTRTDLESIECFIAEDNSARARSFCEAFLHIAVENLATFPCSHPLYNKEKNIRRFIYQNYNLYYQYDTSKKQCVYPAYTPRLGISKYDNRCNKTA
ncbi:type II toxin-antitoxin system RelE/ParE family toxin [Pseudoalteromonas gelatinilytica]